MNRSRFTTHPLVLRSVRVVRREEVSPRLLRLTLAGPELGSFNRAGLSFPAFTAPGFDDHIKLIFAKDGDVASVLPTQHQYGIDWVASDNLLTRDYTPSRFDPRTGEMDLEFVLHGEGPAASWARQSEPGDELWFAGPKSSLILPQGIEKVILVGDETALPALRRFFTERPLHASVEGFIVIEEESARLDFPLSSGDTLNWVVGSPTDKDLLARLVSSLNWDAYPDESTYVFAAGESQTLLTLRRFLRRERRIPKSHLNITGYWHREAPEREEAVTLDRSAGPQLPEQPVLWLAIRTALQVGLIQALREHPLPLATLASSLKLDGTGTETLLQLLTEQRILTQTAGQVALTETGQQLIDNEEVAERFTGYQANQVSSLFGLAQQLTGKGQVAWEHSYDRSLRQSSLADTAIYEELVEQADALLYMGQGLVELLQKLGGRHVLVHGPGSLQVAQLLGSPRIFQALTLIEEPSALELLQASWENSTESVDIAFMSQWRAADLGISALTADSMTDGELTEHLEQAVAHLPRLLLILREGTDELNPRLRENNLLRYASTGHPSRSPEGITQLVEGSGYRITGRSPLGWGLAAYLLEK